MKIFSKLQNLVGQKSSDDEHALAEELEIAKARKKKSISNFFVSQALEELKNLEFYGGTFICSSPDFECYFKKRYMSLFEENDAYIKVAFDKSDNVTHVCGLLPRLQHEKDREKIEDEKITLAKMPDCLLSQAIKKLSAAPKHNMSRPRKVVDQGPAASAQQRTSKAGSVVNQGQTTSRQQQTLKAGNVVYQGRTAPAQQQDSKAGKVVYQGRTASTQHQDSNFVFDPYIQAHSLKGVEKEWLDAMHTSLVDGEYEVLLHLLQHSIIARGFKEKIEHFLITKIELETGSCGVVINAFKFLAREFQFREQTISVAKIGSSLEQAFNLKPKEIFSIIVELFFCLGYEKKIKGYTTGFTELS